MERLWILCVVLAVLLATHTGVKSSPDEYRLLHDVFMNYSNIVRPVTNSTLAVTVTYDAALQQIIDLDEKNQVLTTNLWVRMYWRDDSLQWNPDEYGGTNVIIIPADILWVPDIILYNTADENFNGMMDTNAQAYSDGSVSWFAPAIFKSTCKINVKYFPFDEQRCKMQFGSWAFHGFLIDIVNKSSMGDINNFMDNGEWQLVDMPVRRNVFYYGCCPEPYPDVTFTIVIQRRALFYMFNLLLPCMLISAITLLDFYLPADAGEKVTLGITILLALTVFLLLVAETMPPTSECVPLIAQYYVGTIILVSVSTCMTVVVLGLHYKVPGAVHPVPRWVRKYLLNYTARVLWLGNLAENLEDDESDTVVIENNYLKNNPPEMTEHLNKIERFSSSPSYSRFDYNVVRILKNVEFMVTRCKDQDKDEAIANEWKLVAVVVDRIFLWFFLVATVAITAAILAQAPKIV